MSVRSRYVSLENSKLLSIINICSGRENFVHYLKTKKTMNIFVNIFDELI